MIERDKIVPLYESKFLSLYDLQYAPGKHYYDASRRTADRICAAMDEEAYRTQIPDAVSCVVILENEGEEPRLLLTYEYRYPTGHFLLSIPAGLIDPEDAIGPDAVLTAAKREILEETGLTVKDTDEARVLAPLLFSSPGMTDENNAFALLRLRNADLSALNSEGCVGSELFDGFYLPTKAEARQILESGRDPRGNFYSAQTWMALTVFVNDGK